MPTSIGFIGAGAMGGAVVRRLVRTGHEVRVYDLDPAAVRRCAEAGASPAESPAHAAEGAEFVFTSLPLPEHVSSMWTELLPALEPGAIAVDVSTIDPGTADGLGQRLDKHGHPFVTCALGKTPMAAERGEIPLFVGGEPAALAALRPLLDRIGDTVYDFGSPGAAAMFKLISNLVGMTNVAALAEGHALATRAGIDPELFSAALNDTGARSFQSDVRLPWLVAEDYDARFAVELAAKDVRLALDAGAGWGVPSPVAAAALNQLLATSARGHGREDVVAVARLLGQENPEVVPHER